MKSMRYELFYLVGASREAELESIKNRVAEIITKNGGVFEEKQTVDKRRLAYKIKRDTHGIYIAQRFNLEDVENLKDINDKLNLDGGVIRFIISRASELPELKSKEERIAEATNRERVSEHVKKEKTAETRKPVEMKATAKEEKAKPAKEAEEEKKKVSKEDIDKKLEEILNI